MVSRQAAQPVLIEDDDLARAWGRAVLHVLAHPGTAISPLTLSITGFGRDISPEDVGIRAALDEALRSSKMQSVDTVAGTIFPQSIWRYVGYDRHRLYEQYQTNAPRYRALAPTKNGRGLYFERLIAYAPPGTKPEDAVNQLEFIINAYRDNHGVRASMLQASTFDPMSDHTRAAQLGFPCLQHVTFVPIDGGTLAMNAFYATQQLFDKAYGNYLGLCRLGLFMAREMGLTLARFNCFVGVAKLERVTKRAGLLDPVVEAIRRSIAAQNDDTPQVARARSAR
jgi:hypothetical protein